VRILLLLLFSAVASGDASLPRRRRAEQGWSGCRARIEATQLKLAQRYSLFQGAVIDVGQPWIWVDFLDESGHARVTIQPRQGSLPLPTIWVSDGFLRELQSATEACLADPNIGTPSKNQPK
jgi:hypothetical protein